MMGLSLLVMGLLALGLAVIIGVLTGALFFYRQLNKNVSGSIRYLVDRTKLTEMEFHINSLHQICLLYP